MFIQHTVHAKRRMLSVWRTSALFHSSVTPKNYTNVYPLGERDHVAVQPGLLGDTDYYGNP